MAITIKAPSEIERMRRAGRINAQVLDELVQRVRPGISTADLDSIAARLIAAHGARPAFLHYPNASYPEHPYPATINASIDDELVHGIPSAQTKLCAGQILSIDCGTVFDGYVGDSAVTVPVGEVSPEALRLISITHEALWRGIAVSREGYRVGDISFAIQEWVESQGYHVVREYTGHGVGRKMHEDPQIPNWGSPARGIRLRQGMTFALEPMVTVGPPDLYVRADRWTVATRDGRLCAHFEHTLAITDGEPDVLTMR